MKKFYKILLLLAIASGFYLLLSPLGLIRDKHWQTLLYAIIAIIELLSFVLLVKERLLGLYLLLASFLSLSVILLFIPEDNPAAYINIVMLSILLFFIFIDRKQVLCSLRSGLSYSKNKYYYLIASILIFIVCLLYCFQDKLVSLSSWNSTDLQLSFQLKSDEDYQTHLSSTSLSLYELDYIERMAKEQGVNLSLRFREQINAMRHILVCLHSDNHQPGILEDIIFIYRQDISEQQRRILDWYLDGGEIRKQKWECLGSVNSLEQFYTLLNK